MKISRASSHSGKNTLRTAMTLRGLKCARVCECLHNLYLHPLLFTVDEYDPKNQNNCNAYDSIVVRSSNIRLHINIIINNIEY
jgi:hypothetical protein